MGLSEFYKCQYELEITRKTDLTAALSIPLGVVSLLIGALVLMAKDLHAPLSTLEWGTLALICTSAVACAVVGFHLFKAHTNYTYAFLPTPDVLDRHCTALYQFHRGIGNDEPTARSVAERETLEYIDNAHAIATTQNAALNDEKSGQQFRANQALMVAVVFATAAGVLYVINSISGSPPTQRVEVVNAKEAPANGLSTAPAIASSSPSSAPAASGPGGQQTTAKSPATAASEVKAPGAAASSAKP